MRSSVMQSYTGKLIDLANFTPEDVRLPDIAHALSQINRYTGHTIRPLSVAEHSVTVSMLCPEEHALWGLMHDASEAYLGDVSRPLKSLLPDYRLLEQGVQRIIAQAFRLPWPIPPDVHHADVRALLAEKAVLLSVNHDWGFDGYEPSPYPVHCLSPAEAKAAFEKRYKELVR